MVVEDQEKETNDSQLDDKIEDFASLFEASQQKDAKIIRDSKIQGVIVSISEEWVFVDVGGKSEGAISREELTNNKGELEVAIGDNITAYVVNSRGDDLVLSVKMTTAASEEALRGAKDSGLPVEGFVSAERKGGYTVTVMGKQAFCPFSQMDLQHTGNPEDYIGKKFTFRVIDYSDRGRNIVLSRRQILEEERQEKVNILKKTLQPGDIMEGTVQKLAQFGAFVDIGGIEGLIPMSELAWYRVSQASDVLSPRERVKVKVLDVDWEKNRISLSLKQTIEDPWTTVRERFQEQMVLSATVSKLMNFGAFVELEPGIEGLIHISNLGKGRRINHPKEVLSEGDRVEVKVISVDPSAKRIGLELQADAEAEEDVPEIKVGDIIRGTVESLKEYGAFVALPGRKTGLLHISEMPDANNFGELRSKHPVGSEIQVQVVGIEEGSNKISLSTKALKEKAEQAQFSGFMSGSAGSSSFGTLGDLLKDKFKK
jgi:small subunit ribosomal protein S1